MQNIFDVVKNFGQGAIAIDWSHVLENDEVFSEFFENCDMICISLSFIPGIEESKQIQLIGEISIAMARINYAANIADDAALCYKELAKLEETLKKIAQIDSIVNLAQERFPQLYNIEEGNETAENFIFAQPVTLVAALTQIIDLGGELDGENDSEEDDDCCEIQ